MLEGCEAQGREDKGRKREGDPLEMGKELLFAPVPASVLARTCTPPCTRLRVQITNVLTVKVKERMTSLEVSGTVDNTQGGTRWVLGFVFQTPALRHLEAKTPWLLGISDLWRTPGPLSLF